MTQAAMTLSMHAIRLAITIVFLVFGRPASARAEPNLLPISPDGSRCSPSNGTDAKPSQPTFGFNYFDPFIRLLHDPNDASVEDDFKDLHRHRVPFIRFAACGYWPNEMRMYLDDPEQYWKWLDHIFALAEKYDIGLVPSLFWYRPTVPDLVGESCDQWGNKESKTHAFMRKYTTDVVRRYHDSSALRGWEFGNEYNLDKDLPADPSTLPPIVPTLGTPAVRTERDRLSHDGLVIALHEFAGAVRTIDKMHFVTTGNAAPRASSWHLRNEKSWTSDTDEQYAEMLLAENPPPFVISVHLYKEDLKRTESIGKIARQANRALFIGEFQLEDPRDRTLFHTTLQSMIDAETTMAAVWVYNLPSQKETFSVTTQNERAYQLGAIRDANETSRGDSKVP